MMSKKTVIKRALQSKLPDLCNNCSRTVSQRNALIRVQQMLKVFFLLASVFQCPNWLLILEVLHKVSVFGRLKFLLCSVLDCKAGTDPW